MLATIGTHSFTYPNSPDELTIGQWIDFIRAYGLQLDAQADLIAGMEPGYGQTLSGIQLYAERAFAVAAFFSGLDIEVAKAEMPLPAVTHLYRAEFSKCFRINDDVLFMDHDGIEYVLPEPHLSQASTMTFGEVIDSKVMLYNANVLEWTRWELIRMLCAIFLRPEGDPYREEYGYLDGARAEAMNNYPIRAALLVSGWYETLNRFLEGSFTIFQDSNIKSGHHMKAHFSAWGWVNFLKTIAKTKVFDIPGSGLNSIDCARISKAYDVLLYASEEKGYSEALTADFESKNHTK